MTDRESFTQSNVLTIQTVQIAPFRNLMCVLKDVLLECNITFDAEGMKIICMDKSRTTLVHCILFANCFEFYETKKEKIVIGVNMFHFYKLINTIENEETLTMYIDEHDYVDGIVSHLTLQYTNGVSNQIKTYRFRLIEPDKEDDVSYPEITFSYILNMPSSDFQKMVRDCTYVSEKIEIASVGDEFRMKGSGHIADLTIVRTEKSDGSMSFISKQDSSKIVQGMFSAKSMGIFIKCTPLSPQIEIYLSNDLPIVVKYDVASLGHVKWCLGQVP